jgi:Mlc titration factor MtfA (ptsG expression regulator)
VPVRNDPLGDPLEAMSDSQFDQVLEGLNRVPAGLLARVTGIPIHRSLDARGPHNEVAEYKQTRAAGSTTWERRIVVYNDFFRMNADQKAFTMIHEIGHALDFRPNEASGGTGGPSSSAATGTGSFRAAVRLDGGLGKGVSTYAATTTDYDEYYAEAFAMYQSQPATLKALRPNVYEYFKIQYP